MSSRKRLIHPWGCLLALLLTLAPPRPGGGAAEVIVHPGTPVATLTPATLRSIFGLRRARWPNGHPIRPIVLPDGHPIHADFCRTRLNLYPHQLRRLWNRIVFSGLGQVPTTVRSVAAMIDRVASTPGAIGYVDRLDPGRQGRVVRVTVAR